MDATSHNIKPRGFIVAMGPSGQMGLGLSNTMMAVQLDLSDENLRMKAHLEVPLEEWYPNLGNLDYKTNELCQNCRKFESSSR
ncbi:hypothetical protein CKAN_01884200 [Cinnamomum micranthum f. kanehirae]|uniref:Uncharacterized protein n=1 Tax=Cinnamomum micranthum f. kanehirae TaxID=337451 RepID=A0A3S3N7J3_9MAGN|nr:hypothetical protein CKAN_01884200 [Cinnamomum micranthum f. kanehirae]